MKPGDSGRFNVTQRRGDARKAPAGSLGIKKASFSLGQCACVGNGRVFGLEKYQHALYAALFCVFCASCGMRSSLESNDHGA